MTEVCWFGISTGNWKTPTLRNYVESQMSKESRADCTREPWEAAGSREHRPSRACSTLHWYVSHWCNKLSARGDNWAGATLFPHCRDEILQTEAPINPNSLIPAFTIDSREFILLPKWKKVQRPEIHLPIPEGTPVFCCFFFIWREFPDDLRFKAKVN